MRAFQSIYVGRHDFPKVLPDFLLKRWFTLDSRDRHAIRKAFRSRYWIGAALQLGFVGMTGTTLRSLEYVPASVLRHLGRQLRRPAPDIATLQSLYRRRPTRFEHQRWAVEQWGLREFDEDMAINAHPLEKVKRALATAAFLSTALACRTLSLRSGLVLTIWRLQTYERCRLSSATPKFRSAE